MHVLWVICPYLWGLYIVFSPVNGCHYLILYDFISSTLPPNITSHCYPPKHYSWTLLSWHVITCQEPCQAFELSVLYCQENHRSNLQFSIVVVELWSKFLFGSIKFCMRNLKANTQKNLVFLFIVGNGRRASKSLEWSQSTLQKEVVPFSIPCTFCKGSLVLSH